MSSGDFEGLKYALDPGFDWNDAERVRVFYAPFRAKSLNPDSWEAKRKFWTNVIEKWQTIGRDKVVFTLKDMERELTFGREDLTSHAMKEVLAEDFLHKDIFREEDLKAELERKKSSSSSSTWLLSTIGSFLWANPNKRDLDSDTKLVSKANLARKSREFVEQIYAFEDALKIGSCVIIPEEKIGENSPDRELCMLYLESEKLIHRETIDRIVYLKANKTKRDKIEETSFGETEKNVINLRRAHFRLERQISEKQEIVDGLLTETKKYLKEGQKSRAKFTLKRKKRAEKSLEQTLTLYDNLDCVLDRIKASMDDRDIVKVYKDSLEAMRANLGDVGQVEDLMEEIRDGLAEGKEFSEAVSAKIDYDEEDDQEALEAQLELLIRDDKDKEEEEDLTRRLERLNTNFTDLDDNVKAKKTPVLM